MRAPNLVKWDDTRRWWIFLILAAMLAALFVFTTPLKMLAIALGLVAIWVAIMSPAYLILVVAILLPLEPFLLKFVPDEIYLPARFFSEGLIYLLALVAVIRVVMGKRRVPRTPLDVPFVLFLLAALASAIINFVPPTVAVLGVRQIIRFIILYYAVVTLGPAEKFLKRTLAVLFGVVLFEAALGIIQYASQGALDPILIPGERKFFESIQLTIGTIQFFAPGSRVFATLGRYDQLGTFLVFFMLLAVGFLYERLTPRDRGIFYWLLALGLPALLFTFSRASWFGFLIGLIVIAIILKRDKWVLSILAGGLAAIVVYAAVNGLVVKYIVEYPEQTFVERFLETFSVERFRNEYYGLGRTFFLVQTPLVVIPSSPIFGVGPGQYGGGAAAAMGRPAKYDEIGIPFGIFGTEGFIDNNWFSLWGEIGTLGLLLYAMMFLALLRTALRVARSAHESWARGLALGYVGALAAVTFQAFLGTYLEVRTLAFYLWLVGAYLVIIDQRLTIARSGATKQS